MYNTDVASYHGHVIPPSQVPRKSIPHLDSPNIHLQTAVGQAASPIAQDGATTASSASASAGKSVHAVAPINTPTLPTPISPPTPPLLDDNDISNLKTIMLTSPPPSTLSSPSRLSRHSGCSKPTCTKARGEASRCEANQRRVCGDRVYYFPTAGNEMVPRRELRYGTRSYDLCYSIWLRAVLS